ncbi:hypothetical protein ACS0TY_031985 [Phlomoides rotata]
MNDHNYLQERSILALTLDVANSNFDVHTPEFLNTLKCSGVPDHEITLKIGTPVMLLRNIDHSKGLCNGTRLINLFILLVITRLRDKIIEAMTLTGSSADELTLISRLSLTPSDTRFPFKFQRRQFPLIVSYVMLINKSQGQSFSHIGLLFLKSVFSHGQLYVAVSRITNRSGLKDLLCNSDNDSCNKTKNIVFREN